MRSAADAGGEEALIVLQTSLGSSGKGGNPLSSRTLFFVVCSSFKPPNETCADKFQTDCIGLDKQKFSG